MRPIDCPNCDSTGLDPEAGTAPHDEPCPVCGGTGELEPPTDDDAYDRKGNR